jgi:4-alpha-glucanotransferase
MKFPRKSGILLHPTSLPGPYGIGEIGPQARAFVECLADMKQHIWQILPLGPTGYGDSPYQSLSTFAGNPLLISFDQLVEDGLLSKAALRKFPHFDPHCIDYGEVIEARMPILKKVCHAFEKKAPPKMHADYRKFCHRERHWLDDYALFIALKNAHGGRPWIEWEDDLILRDPDTLDKMHSKFIRNIQDIKMLQFLFYDQWHRLRKFARKKKVRIVGDIPIFVAHDSADVWAHPELFYIDLRGRLIVQAGVPPDYFSRTGQLWGNPLYNWMAHRKTGYRWWVNRMKQIFKTVDIVRIDHFRGFEKYWQVPGNAENAMNGSWVEGPDAEFFEALTARMGRLPIIAEDLGVITPEVDALRDRFAFPGMRILQFAFGNDPKAKTFRPDNYPQNCVVYTGTHDNDTTVGWFNSKAGQDSTRSAAAIRRERKNVLQYVKTDGREIHWDMIGLAFKSRANTAVVPMQDVMGLGTQARMNQPGRPAGNWRWRFSWDMLTDEMRTRLRTLTEMAGRNDE